MLKNHYSLVLLTIVTIFNVVVDVLLASGRSTGANMFWFIADTVIAVYLGIQYGWHAAKGDK